MNVFDNRVAIITGAARGIGQAIASRLAEAGCRIALWDVIDLSETKSICQSKGTDVIEFVVDVRNKRQIAGAAKETVDKWGRIDIFVNNAGVFDNTATVDLSEETWDRVSDINYKSMYLTAQAVAPHMLKNRWGRIVNMSSMAGKMAYPKEIAYCSTKAAVLGLTRALAIEFGPKGITANAICPGPIDTDMLTNTHQILANEFGITLEEWEQNVIDTIPVGRLGKPEEIGALVAFLVSEEAAFINGQAINIDGGMVFY